MINDSPPPSFKQLAAPTHQHSAAIWFARLKKILLGCMLALVLFLLVCGVTLALIVPKLPSMEAVTDYRPKIPLRVYTADNALIGEFGEERRTFVKIEDVPKHMKQAILAIEDDRFYEHSGIDYIGITRAALSNLTGGTGGGASTITQQVARNFFLTSNEPSVLQKLQRKAYEILLSFKLEEQLSKDKILELYINQIFLGQRAYGFAAASQVYFGVPLKEVSIEQAAMLAGIPKFPGSANPVANFARAKSRQNYILERMKKLGYITPEQHTKARANPMTDIRQSTDSTVVRADYVAEMARKVVFEKYGDSVYSMGLQVYTTILKDDQAAAYDALRTGLLNYDRRHGYRGPEGFVSLPAEGEERDEAIDNALNKHPNNGQLLSAVVTAVTPKLIVATLSNAQTIEASAEGLKLVSASLNNKSADGKRIIEGSIIRVIKEKRKDGTPFWSVIQIPEVEAAHLAINPSNGAVRALVGGFDFNKNKFNHVTQGWRQPGSSFKPFIYSAALERGYRIDTIVEDEPFTIDAGLTGGKAWEPKNYDGKFEGPMQLRTALAKSKNMVSIRLMQAVGGSAAQEWVTRFGFEADKHPPYLTMALGAGATTVWQMSEAYAVFANGGYKINTFIINKVLDGKGNVLMQAKPKQAGDELNAVISPRNAYLMHTMMQDVVRVGTATKANVLKRGDLAGKTGTTNDSIDAWFAGYASQVVAVTWAGFDIPKSLGDKETGGGVALPIWIDYMAKVLPKLPEIPRSAPDGMGGSSTITPEAPNMANNPPAAVPAAAPTPSTGVTPAP